MMIHVNTLVSPSVGQQTLVCLSIGHEQPKSVTCSQSDFAKISTNRNCLTNANQRSSSLAWLRHSNLSIEDFQKSLHFLKFYQDKSNVEIT